MLVSALSIVAFATSGLLSASPANALDFTQAAKRATDFTFNLFSGPELQDQISTESPSQLFYTTGGGVP
jgi:hypothetical protein